MQIDKKKIFLLLVIISLLIGGIISKSKISKADCAAVCLDFDGDGRGSPASSACDFPELDCNDSNDTIWASDPEGSAYSNCTDGNDNDCDGMIDCADDSCATAANCISTCVFSCNDHCLAADPGNTVIALGDCCNASEVCYACASGFAWDGVACVTDCTDTDGDRYVAGTVDWTVCSNCGLSGNEVCLGNNDCDDTDKHIFPGNLETCDAKNNDCFGVIDDGCDEDGDDYCNDAMMVYDNSICPNSSFDAVVGVQGDDCDDTALTGGDYHPLRSEECDAADHNCDGNNFDTLDREVCQAACEADGFFWTGNAGTLNCCGNDNYEGSFGANIFQSGGEFLPTDLCSDGVDNDCSGTCDLVADACGSGSVADPSCTGACNDTGENDIGIPPCNKCGNLTDDDGNQTFLFPTSEADWIAAGFGDMIDQCDPKCGPGVSMIDFDSFENDGTNPKESTCDDGIDNDCDGLVDCLDVLDCANNGAVDGCGGIDNDCDGNTDEDCGACVPTADPTEICDGFDNDCDGNIDNNPTGGALLPLQLSICAGFEQTCTSGVWEDNYSIIPNYQVIEANCDDTFDNDCDGLADCLDVADCANNGTFDDCGGIDNDCDGVIDEDCTACVPTADPTEICDGLDNDCDGNIDNNPMGGALLPLQLSICAGFEQTCNGGVWEDNYNIIPNYEVSEVSCGDAIDNDCDGLADCLDVADCANNGEVDDCDGIDNDCDGGIDEDCGTCVPTADPTEICDGVDNDCDGIIDNGCVFVCGFPIVLPCYFP